MSFLDDSCSTLPEQTTKGDEHALNVLSIVVFVKSKLEEE